MIKNIVAIGSLAYLFVIFFVTLASTAEILEPQIRIKDDNIIVNASITGFEVIESTINSGIKKQIVFTIELHRALSFWPDEFVTSKKIKKTLRYDNLRGHFLASSNNGTSQIQKSFKDFNNMKDWVFSIKNVNLGNIKELKAGTYYIRTVIESKSKELPPVISFLMLFIPEVETSLARESQTFRIGVKGEKS